MNIAIIGCGFVADFYMKTLKNYKQLNLIKVFDKDKKRLIKFCSYYGLEKAKDFREILNDKDINIILNLTNPRDHYNVNKQCLMSNKHVYSEKPLSMNFKDSKELFFLAKRKKLKLASAPSSVLNLTARTLKKFIDEKKLVILS